MKKFLVLTATSIISMFICCVYANTSEVNTTMQTRDCKRAGNVEVRTFGTSDGKVIVEAYNYNDYRVTVKYTLYATNGDKTYPINSGVFSIAAKDSNGYPGKKTSDRVSVPDGYSYYLVMENPEYCS